MIGRLRRLLGLGSNPPAGGDAAAEQARYTIEVSHHLGSPLVVLSGEIDHHSANQVRLALERELVSPDQVVLFDLNGLTYLDSGGLALLFDLIRTLEEGWVGVIHPAPNVRRLLQISGLDTQENFRVFDDLEEARAALEADGSAGL
ncbi:MAG: STAS domain-containing protein [Thermoleophilia bacterium]|nr:STAS domain-containing protein [Thermoleophilia bacterium]